MKKFNRPLPVLFLTLFVDSLGFGILIPIIPQLLANPRSTFFLLPSGLSVQDGYVLLGYLVAIFPIMQFLATPILGQLSDAYGRKKILAISLFGTCISYAIFALAIYSKNIPLLFASRALDGITGGNISVAQAAIADITTPENRVKNFGLIGAAFGIGFIIGPYLGGKLSDPGVVSWFNATTPFWFAAILSFINVMSVLFILPETLKNASKTVTIAWNKSVQHIAEAIAFKDLRVVFLTVFLFFSGFTFFTTFFSVFLINKFSFSQGNIGDFFSYVGIWIAITQVVLTRALSKRVKESKILRITFIGAGIGVLLFFLPRVSWQLLFVVPVFSAFIGLSMANVTALISKSKGELVQGEILGINASVQALAQALPPILSGYIAATLVPEAPIIVSGVIMIISGLVFLLFYKTKTAKE